MNVIELNNQIIEACNKSITMSIAYIKVGIPYSTFKRKAIKLGVWQPNQAGRGVTKSKTSLQDVFDGISPMRSYNLKNRLIQEGYKEAKCEHCKTGEEWNGQVLVLELDHINGNNRDNRLKNLRILCPNCHSQTPTFRGRNIKNALMVEW